MIANENLRIITVLVMDINVYYLCSQLIGIPADHKQFEQDVNQIYDELDETRWIAFALKGLNVGKQCRRILSHNLMEYTFYNAVLT